MHFITPICMKIVNVDLQWLLVCERLIENCSRIEEDTLIIDNKEALSYLYDYSFEWINCIKGQHNFFNSIIVGVDSTKRALEGLLRYEGKEYTITPDIYSKDKLTFKLKERKYD